MKKHWLKLVNPPKVSLNEWYGGKHWSERSKLKNNYQWIVFEAFKELRENKINEPCAVTYNFIWGKSSRPLDASNCVAMVKLIEDQIFKSDAPHIVTQLTIASIKNKFQKENLIVDILIQCIQ